MSESELERSRRVNARPNLYEERINELEFQIRINEMKYLERIEELEYKNKLLVNRLEVITGVKNDTY